MTSQDFLDDLWGSSEEKTPTKSSKYNSVDLSIYFRDSLINASWYKGFGIVNLRALAGQFAKWKKTGLTRDQAYGMVDAYMSTYTLRGNAPGWQDFVNNRDKILGAVDKKPEAVEEWDEDKAMQEYLARRKR